MQYQKYALALLCSVSLTSCWSDTDETEQLTKTTRSSTVRHVDSDTDFNRTIKEGNVVIDFYADWCGPCKRLGPIISDLAAEFTNIDFVKVNIDKTRSLGSRYNVKSIPTLILFKDGKQIKKISGYKSKSELRSILKAVF